MNFGDPKSTGDVAPLVFGGLFEGATLDGTQLTRHWVSGRQETLSTHPLALGYIGHTVTLLANAATNSSMLINNVSLFINHFKQNWIGW